VVVFELIPDFLAYNISENYFKGSYIVSIYKMAAQSMAHFRLRMSEFLEPFHVPKA
jgi:hypothetical protein